MMLRTAVLLAILAPWGCSGNRDDDNHRTPADGGNESIQASDGDTDSTTTIPTDTATPKVTDKVYAHSATTLYQVDPDDLTLTAVGDFGWPTGMETEEMTDIALDGDGKMVGVSFGNLYSVDKETAECTFLAPLGSGFNGLSFVEGADATAQTALVGATTLGEWYTLDPNTGAAVLIGTYGGGMSSSGDIVFVRDAGAFATVNHPDFETDVLVSVSPDSGEATVIGETGFQSIWGVGYWGGQIFGFTDNGEFILIDAATGLGTLVETVDTRFWGAGVTTVAPVVV
jgi:hypothetical protein